MKAWPEWVRETCQWPPGAVECHHLKWFRHFRANDPAAKVRVQPSPILDARLEWGSASRKYM
jgi:hypothetical protein